MEASPSQGPEFEGTPWSAQRADALVDMAKGYLQGTRQTKASHADSYQIMIHVDAQALENNQGRSDLPLESVRRLSCDGSLITITEDAKGEPLNIGRKQRAVPTAIKRALWARDKGCRFPGCCNARFVDAHHILHWSKGGETSLDNLMLLCSRHHRLVHEGGYQICKDFAGQWYFKRPDGRAIPRLGLHLADMTDDYDDSAESFAPDGTNMENRSEVAVAR